MSDDVERTLCQLPSCYVYKAPPRTSAEGYRASNFPKDHMWTGKLKIVAKGREASIFLIDENNAVFAASPVTEGSVERTVDSGRYFILKIVNPLGKHAYIGLAFNERNDAFDFNVALQEHKAECEREDQAAAGITSALSSPMRDLSLKAGEKIKINVPKRRKDPIEEGGSGFNAGPSGSNNMGILLPKPRADTESTPSSSFPLPKPSAPPSATSSGSSASTDQDVFGSFTSSSSASSSFSTDTEAFPSSDPFATANLADPFAGFKSSASSASTPASGPFVNEGGADPFSSSSDPFGSGFTPTATSTDPFESSTITSAPNNAPPLSSSDSDPFAIFGSSKPVAPAPAQPPPKPTGNLIDFDLMNS